MSEIPNGVESVEVIFTPQKTHKDRYYSIEDKKRRFVVPIEDATDDEGNLLDDDSYDSDVLKEHPNAPREVKEWEGPFYIVLGELNPDNHDAE